MRGKEKGIERIGAVMVAGGGIGGIQASLDLAESGFKVYLVEARPTLGGVMAQLDKTFPTNDCSMCIISPKLVDCGRHLNVEMMTNAEIVNVSGQAGDFTVTVKQSPRYVDEQKCNGCGLCAQVCPIDAVDAYNRGLSERSAIYVDYPQAVPLVYVIDRERCIGCGLCDSICLAEAINYSDRAKAEEIRVGAIIAVPGVEEFDAHLKGEYGYGEYPNVVTSVEFERILSASGPYKGLILRPSDGRIARRIAFIQCVGSRDATCGNTYCSSVCCMYATKEAVVAKEHWNQVQPTIFYMDMRSHGKDFDKYVERAKEEYGVRYIRFRVSELKEAPDTHDLRIRYEDEEGQIQEEEFNLVVLSVGLQPSKDVRDLADTLGIELNEHGFCKTSTFRPLETSRQGVLACGTFSSPKDIPETVAEASGAACLAGDLLSSGRSSLTREKEYPPELDVAGDPPRIGVFVCRCGINIGGVVDVPAVVNYAQTLPSVIYAEENLYTCSQDTQETIRQKINEHGLNRVVVVSCSPRTHENLFRETIREAGLNQYLFEMANIRDQCSWVHMREPEAATEKAKDLMRMAVSKARGLQPLQRPEITVDPRCLVIGGGVSGMTASLGLAEQGFGVYLIEREDELGGILRKIHYTLEQEGIQQQLRELIERVESNPLIHISKKASIKSVSGYAGNFETVVECDSSGDNTTLNHGAIIVATGAKEYEPREYSYGVNPRVLSQLELEDKIARSDDLTHCENVVMIQCVGSRDNDRPFCSRFCCSEAMKNALKIKEVSPSTNVWILYRDVRTYGLRENFYTKALEAGVVFIRYDEDDKPVVTTLSRDGQDESLQVSFREPITGEKLTIDADLLVLSVGVTPPKENADLAQMLRVPLNEDGFFLEAHAKLRPVDFATEGIYLCGLAHSPRLIDECISQAYAAASRASTLLSKNVIEAEATVATILEARCTGCGVCVSVCAYNAIEIDEKEQTAKINSALCKGCGACSAACRCGAIDLMGYTGVQVLSMLNALEEVGS